MAAVKKDSRTRNFATVVYPESAPENWIQILEDEKTPVFISPLHDKDKEESGDENKKSHYHVIIMYDGNKSNDQIKVVFDKIGGVGIEKVNTLRGYARYLCHLDSPHKAQYQTEKVIALSGADYSAIISLASDRYTAIKDMMEFCNRNDVSCYAELITYTSIYRYDWFRVLCDSGTLVIKEYLKSRTWSKKNGAGDMMENMERYNLETGEKID